jgi:hypothetical protein
VALKYYNEALTCRWELLTKPIDGLLITDPATDLH